MSTGSLVTAVTAAVLLEGNFLDNALKALPVVATSPLALVAYGLTLLAWVLIAFKLQALRAVNSLPESDRLRMIEQLNGNPLPGDITAEEWLRGKRQQYALFGFLAVCGLVALIIVKAGLTHPYNATDAKLTDLRNREKHLHQQYEKWKRLHDREAVRGTRQGGVDERSANGVTLTDEILRDAPVLIGNYGDVRETTASSEWLGIEKYQRISALHSYLAGILIEDPQRRREAIQHADAEVSAAESGLRLGEEIRRRSRAGDETVADDYKFFAENPPTEEQVLEWYRANGKAVQARAYPGDTGKRQEAAAAIEPIGALFSDESDASMDWVMGFKGTNGHPSVSRATSAPPAKAHADDIEPRPMLTRGGRNVRTGGHEQNPDGKP